MQIAGIWGSYAIAGTPVISDISRRSFAVGLEACTVQSDTVRATGQPKDLIGSARNSKMVGSVETLRWRPEPVSS